MELQLRQLSGSARWHHSGCPRTQSSIIVSDNGKEWVLCNASPDISQQIANTPS
nr:Pyrroloquinoline quinone biosynthesis protein B [Klebsiella pneumoniae]